MHCGLCGLQWSVRDEERPQCNPPRVVEGNIGSSGEFEGRVYDAVVIDEAATITPEQWDAWKEAMKTGDWSAFNGDEDR